MAADPSTLGESRVSRTGAGIGIAIAIGVTIGAVALLAPRLREEMREDIFSAPPAASAPLAATPKAPAPAASPMPALASAPVPAASLAPGESVVALAPASAAATPATPVKGEPLRGASPDRPKSRATRAKSPKALARQAPRETPRQAVRQVAAPAPREEVREARAIPDAPLRSYREREPLPPRREWRAAPRREDPWDYRTWREHRNPDMPSNSPTDRQPG